MGTVFQFGEAEKFLGRVRGGLHNFANVLNATELYS